MNQQQLGAAENQRKQEQAQIDSIWSSKLGQCFVWAIIIMAGLSYCGDRKKKPEPPAKAKPAATTIKTSPAK